MIWNAVPKVHSIISKTTLNLTGSAADDRPNLSSSLEQFGRLVADNLQIARLIDIRIVAIHQLQDFAFGNDIGRLGKHARRAYCQLRPSSGKFGNKENRQPAHWLRFRTVRWPSPGHV